MNKIFIEGTDIGDDTDDLDEFNIDVGYNSSTRSYINGLSKTITVTGRTYENIKKAFLKCGKKSKLNAVFSSPVCKGVSIDLEINKEGVQIYPDGRKASLTMKSVSEENKSYNYLNSHTIFDSGFAENNRLPIVYYADQPNWIQWTVLIVTGVIRRALNIIDNFVNSVCVVLDRLVFWKKFDCDYNLSGIVFEEIDTWITGLGRWAAAPLVRDIIKHQCSAANLSFSSSILNNQGNQYYNMALFVLTAGKHGSHEDISKAERVNVLNKNAPLLTTIDLLELLKPVFNADYRIIEGVLYFEKESYFKEIAVNDIIELGDICDEDYYYSFPEIEKLSFVDIRFTMDAYDTEGNSMLPYYSSVLDLDNDTGEQKGSQNVNIGFGAVRFMFDQNSRDVKGFFDWQRVIDYWRTGGGSYDTRHFFQNEGIKRDNDLILSGNMLSSPKLLILEDDFDYDDAKTIKKEIDDNFWCYNYPLLLKEELGEYQEDSETLEGLVRGDLYNEIASSISKEPDMIIPKLKVPCNCAAVEIVLNKFDTLGVVTPFGKGFPERGVVTTTENGATLELSNIVIYCD